MATDNLAELALFASTGLSSLAMLTPLCVHLNYTYTLIIWSLKPLQSQREQSRTVFMF
jgi:hypothetical protein